MSYVVLARKYRPMRFADMVGQEHIGRTLGNAIAQGRVHHAYLFSGARGLGKTTTARIFAKALVCESGPTAEPCNECPQCIAVTEGRSVDVIEVDGASNNSVENIRNLREQVNYLPQSARRKVYIIDEVHMLTTSAFNALLKTLEEPPAHVNFVFATTESHKVLATILSRVSRLDFRRVSVAQLADHLGGILRRENLGMAPAGLRLVARAAGGSVRDAMTLLDQVIAFAADPTNVSGEEVRAVLGHAERSAVAELVDAVLAHDVEQVLQRFDLLTGAGHDLTVLSVQMLEDLRDLTVAKVSKNHRMFLDATDEELTELRRRVATVDAAALMQLFDRMGRVVDRLAHARSQRLVLEMGLLELAQAEPLVPLADLVARLEALKNEGGGAPASGSGSSGARPMRGGGEPPPRSRPTGSRSSEARAGEEESPGRRSHEVSPPGSERAETHRGPSGGFVVPPAQETSPAGPAPVQGAGALAGPEPARVHESAGAAPVQRAGVKGGPGNSPGSTPPPPNSGFATPFAQSLWALARENGVVPGTPEEPGAAAVHDTAHQAGIAPVAVGRTSSPTSSPALVKPPIALDDPMSAWAELVAAIREDDEYASAVLGEVGVVEFSSRELRVVAPRGSFAHTELSSSDLRGRVERAVNERCGVALPLTLEDDTPRLPERPSLVLLERQRREDRRIAAEAEAHADPAIALLLRDFEAQIVATKPL